MAAFDILKFLEHYQQHPCLWDKCQPDFKNRSERDSAESALLEVSGLGSRQILRAKIRAIRGTYNNEIRKIKKSTMTGSGADELYRPKLHWFNYAHSFLYKNYEDDQPQFDLDLESNLTHYDHGNYAKQNDSNEEIVNRQRPAEIITQISSPSKPSRIQKRVIDLGIRTASTGVGKGLSRCGQERKFLKNFRKRGAVCNSFPSDDEFMVFGQSVGIQLSKLPLHKALLVQHDIQSILTKARLGELIPSSPTGSHSPAHSPTWGIESSSLSYIRNSDGVCEEVKETNNEI